MILRDFGHMRSVTTVRPPTQKHRAGIWESMLGAIYAMNAAGEVRYFGHDYEAAFAFLGDVEDVRSSRFHNTWRKQSPYGQRSGVEHARPRHKQHVWFVRDVQA
jgi:hypothetical protein